MKNDIRLAYVDRGAVLMQQKQYTEGVAASRRAVELDPPRPDAHYRLGRVYQAMGDSKESQKQFAKVHELHKKKMRRWRLDCRKHRPRCLNRETNSRRIA